MSSRRQLLINKSGNVGLLSLIFVRVDTVLCSTQTPQYIPSKAFCARRQSSRNLYVLQLCDKRIGYDADI